MVRTSSYESKVSDTCEQHMKHFQVFSWLIHRNHKEICLLVLQALGSVQHHHTSSVSMWSRDYPPNSWERHVYVCQWEFVGDKLFSLTTMEYTGSVVWASNPNHMTCEKESEFWSSKWAERCLDYCWHDESTRPSNNSPLTIAPIRSRKMSAMLSLGRTFYEIANGASRKPTIRSHTVLHTPYWALCYQIVFVAGPGMLIHYLERYGIYR